MKETGKLSHFLQTEDGKKRSSFLSLREAARVSGYAKNYISQLCRLNRIVAIRDGENWLVSHDSLLSYKTTTAQIREERMKTEFLQSVPVKTPFRFYFFSAVKYISIALAVMSVGFFVNRDQSVIIYQQEPTEHLAVAATSFPQNIFAPLLSSVEDFPKFLGKKVGSILKSKTSPNENKIVIYPPPLKVEPQDSQRFNLGEEKSSAPSLTQTPVPQSQPTIVERIILAGISHADLDLEMEKVNAKILSEANLLRALIYEKANSNFHAIALTNKIDTLSGVTLNSVTISGITGLTDADIPNTITASNYLPLTGGTITSNLTVQGNFAVNGIPTFVQASTTRLSVNDTLYVGGIATTTIRGDNATSTFAGGIEASRVASWTYLETPSFTATSTTATSTIAGYLDLAKGFESGANASVVFHESAPANALFLGANGFLGIGTSSPSKTFSLQGDAYVSGSSFFGGAITATSSLWVQGNLNASSTASIANLATLMGGFISNASSSIAALQIAGTFNASSTSFFNGLATFNNATATRLTVTNDAWFATTGGFVGIATTSPWGLLSVNPNALGTDVPSFVIGSSTETWFQVDNGGIVTASKLANLQSGFISNASSSVSAGLQVAGALNASSTFQVAGASNLGGALTVTSGNLATLIGGFISNASSSIGAGLQVAGAFNASSTSFFNSNAIFSSNVGIGTSSPNARLSVEGNAFITGSLTAGPLVGTSTLTIMGTGTSSIAYGLTIATSGGLVGIGTSTPAVKLHVFNTVSGAQFRIGYNKDLFTDFKVDAVGDLTLSPTGTTSPAIVNSIRMNDDNLFICSGGACPSPDVGNGMLTTSGNLIVENQVGIGTSTPAWKFQIASDLVNPTNSTKAFLVLSDTSAGTDLKHWFFSSQGGNLYVGTTTDGYATSSISALTILNNGNIGVGTTSPTHTLDVAGDISASQTFFFSDGSTQVGAGTPDGNSWHASSATFLQSTTTNSNPALNGTPMGLFFKPDGTKMYVTGISAGKVYEYTLTTPWNTSTALYIQSTTTALTLGTSPQGLFFKPDGTKMYVIMQSNDVIAEFALSIPWNVSTAVYSKKIGVGSNSETIAGLFFKPDGKKIYITDTSQSAVFTYIASVPWDITSLSGGELRTNLSVSGGLAFKSDGTAMYLMNLSGGILDEYTLSTPWSISTAVFAQTSSVGVQDGIPQELRFKPDGTKMYVVGNSNKKVFEYNLGITFGRNTAVGIGTTTPATKLQVSNGTNATTTITIGELGSLGAGAKSKTCINMNTASGSPASVYLNNGGTAWVIETKYCL